MFSRIKRALVAFRESAEFVGKDEKPLTLSMILAKDSCSRLAAEFSDYHLKNCKAAVIVYQQLDGSLNVLSDDDTETLKVIGMLDTARDMVGYGME